MVRRLFLWSGPVAALLVVVVFGSWSGKSSPGGPRGEAVHAENALYHRLARDGVVRLPETGYAIFAENVQGKKLLHAVVKHQDAAGNLDFVVRAKAGDLRVNPGKKVLCIRLKKGHYLGGDGSRSWFEERFWELPLPDESEE